MTMTPREALLRTIAVGLLNVVAITHLVDLSHKLEEGVAYMATLFSLLIVACVVLALVLVRRRPRALRGTWIAIGTLSAATLAGYALSRVVALPRMADHVGDWTSTAGIVSVSAEIALLALAAHALRSAGGSRAAGRATRRAPRLAGTAAGVALLLAVSAAGMPGLQRAHAHAGVAVASGAADHAEPAAPAAAGEAQAAPAIPRAVTLAAILLAVAFTAAAATSLRRRSYAPQRPVARLRA